MEDNDPQLSEFNSNLASLKRVDEALKRCVYARSYKNPIAYHDSIVDVYLECVYKMNGKFEFMVGESGTKLQKIDNKVALFLKNINDNNIKDSLMHDLRLFEIYLRIFMGHKGMLLADKWDDSGL